ncbi:hypothetical protein KFE98_12090 [bacterium SCSIO 12741]|nr:hypothetical protein KFE98_12090 [bacterium SCSIO 12741]
MGASKDSLESLMPETSIAGDTAGYAMAWDVSGSAFTYKALTGDWSKFDLNTSTGVITVASGQTFDYESNDTLFALQYEVDAGGSTVKDSAVVVIRVQDVLEGKALAFDGVNDYVDITNGNSLNLTGDMTFEGWIYPTADQGVIAMNGFSISNGNERGWAVAIGASGQGGTGNTKSLLFASSDNSGNYNAGAAVQSNASTIVLNEWQHIAAVKNGTLITLYRNGQVLTTGNIARDSIVYTGTPEFYLGQRTPSETSYFAGLFEGKMDEVRVWNHARTQSEIQAKLNCELVGNECGLVAYYAFENGYADGENAGLDSVYDGSGNGFVGILKNSALSGGTSNWTFPTDSLTNECDSQDLVDPAFVTIGDTTLYLDNTGNATLTADDFYTALTGNCPANMTVTASPLTFNCNSTIDTGNVSTGSLEFDGSTNYVSVPHDASLNPTSEITVEAWIYAHATSGTPKIVGKCKNGGASNGWSLGLVNGKVGAEYYTTSGNPIQQSSSTISTNTWTHVAMSWKTNGQKKVYINGVLAGSGSATAFNLGTETNAMHIGIAPYNTTQYHFDGEIAEIRVWNVQRSDAQIAADYNDALTGNETGLVAYYKFNDGTGSSTVLDHSTNSNTGNLTNMDPATDWKTGPSQQIIGVPVTLTAMDEYSQVTKDTVWVVLEDTVTPSFNSIRDTILYVDASGNVKVPISSLYTSIDEVCAKDYTVTANDTDWTCADVSGYLGGVTTGLRFPTSRSLNTGKVVLPTASGQPVTIETWMKTSATSHVFIFAWYQGV